jgi:hypothetical protein
MNPVRRHFTLGISAVLLCGSVPELSAETADTVAVRIRLDDSAIQAIPPRVRQELSVSEDNSPSAQELIAAAPPQKAIPVILIAIGILSIPIIWDAILEMIRETEYGGVLIDMRVQPTAISNSKAVPAEFILIIHPDGSIERVESQGFSRSALESVRTLRPDYKVF